jgi:hypothetical protein
MSRLPSAGADAIGAAAGDPSPRPSRPTALDVLTEPQDASLELGAGRVMKASVRVSPVGLLAIAALVSGILLSTRALVGTAIRESRRPRG